MIEKINELIGEVEQFKAENKEQLENFRIRILGSKGVLKDLFQHFKTVNSRSRYFKSSQENVLQ